MGRIKTKLIKRSAQKLMETYKDKFSKDFTDNKVILAEVAEIGSKKLRNVAAGYLVRLVKKREADVTAQ